MNPRSGQVTVLDGFRGADGSQFYPDVTPNGGVTYGVAWYGGAGTSRTVFKLDASGELTQIYAIPDSAIDCPTVVGHLLYGTASFCGAGTVFDLDSDSGQASLRLFHQLGAGDSKRNRRAQWPTFHIAAR